ncbi:MAG: hypothetical protein WCH21_03050 [Bacteroidota bacterium]
MVSIEDNEAKQIVEIIKKDNTQLSQLDLDKINELSIKFDETYGIFMIKFWLLKLNLPKNGSLL